MHHPKTVISALIILIGMPLLVLGGYALFRGKQYYLISILMLILAMLPFLFTLEKKLQVRELVITASTVALSVASRGAFFYLPNIKPMCAMLIMAGLVFGAQFGFITGALTMLLSGFMFGQGVWTPFQMLGMGLTVFITVELLRGLKIKNRFVMGAISGIMCFALYGLVVDFSSVLMWVTDFNMKSVLSVYLSGISFNAIHGLTTGVLVALFEPAVNEKLMRIRVKYGIFQTGTEKDL